MRDPKDNLKPKQRADQQVEFDYNGYPKSLDVKTHTKKCIQCNRDYSSIRAGFNEFLPRTKPAEYHTVCLVCQHEKVTVENFRRTADKHAYQKAFREEVKKAAMAHAKAISKKRSEGAKKARIPDMARAETAKRELSRRRLINFIMRFNPNYKPGWVHKLICAKLEFFSRAVYLELAPRSLFFMPPRLGKSEIASKNFPAWHLGHHPDHEIIAASYAVSLPMGFSRKIKQLLENPAYKSMFPGVTLNPKAQATEGWYTTKGGGYVPAGVGLGITGKGAHVLIIDDPVKDMQEADSETVRNNVWDWWDSTAETRLSPGGGVLGIQTRWNDDDWSGRLLTQEMEALREIEEQRNEIIAMLEKAKEDRLKSLQIDMLTEQLHEVDRSVEDVVRWDVLSLPALAEHDEFATDDGQLLYERVPGSKPVRKKDEALHPERYNEAFFKRKRKSSQPRIWSALYQQNPVPDSGVYFKDTMFRYEEVVPDYSNMNVYIAWDLAIGQKHTNDWTVGVVGAHDFDDRLHIINVVRARTADLAELVVGTCEPYKNRLQLIGLEQGVIQMAAKPAIDKLLEEKRWYPVFDDSLKPVTDKDARARPAQGWMQQGRILLPRNQPWVEPFTMELLRFPGGAFDDQVDALAWLVRMVAQQAPPRRQQPKKKLKSWKDRLNMRNSVSNHQAA